MMKMSTDVNGLISLRAATILDIEKMDNESSGFRITEVSQFIITCTEQFHGVLIEKELSLKTNLTKVQFFAKLDQHHFQRVLHNILTNAVKFSHIGGVITITSEIIDNVFHISIKDNGAGIPVKMQGFYF